MAAFVFSVFGAQPLTIAGVTGAPLFLHPQICYSLMGNRSYNGVQQDYLQHNPKSF